MLSNPLFGHGGAVDDMTDSKQVGSENTPHLRNHLSKLIPVVYICQRRQRQHKNQRLRQPFTTPNPSRNHPNPNPLEQAHTSSSTLNCQTPNCKFVWCLTPASATTAFPLPPHCHDKWHDAHDVWINVVVVVALITHSKIPPTTLHTYVHFCPKNN